MWLDTAGPTLTNHYTGTGDSPAWTETTATAGAWTRYLADPDGGLAATISHTGTVELHLANLHGDIVATAAPTDTTPTTYTETTEYGQPRNPTTARYGWLGSHQRATDTVAGLTLMGVRLYNPTTGRFLSVDPVPGGNANDYEYCTGDPVNCVDLDGRWGWLRKVAKAATYMPGFIGTAANIGWAGYYASRGQWGRAAGHAVGAASFGITRYTSLVGRYAQRSRALGSASRLFGRGKIGRFNRNDRVRLGWTWRGSAQKGRNMLSLRVGSKRTRFFGRRIHVHYHLIRGV